MPAPPGLAWLLAPLQTEPPSQHPRKRLESQRAHVSAVLPPRATLGAHGVTLRCCKLQASTLPGRAGEAQTQTRALLIVHQAGQARAE